MVNKMAPLYDQTTYSPAIMINHHVMGLNVSVHNSLAVTEIQRFEQFIHIKAHIKVLKPWIERAEVCIVNMLEN